MELHVYKSADEVITGLADFCVRTINEVIAAKGECNLVLSGGNSPKKLYELLVSASYKNKVDWSRTWFFFGDERYVPFTDKDNNGLMAKQSLFDPLNIDEAKIKLLVDQHIKQNPVGPDVINVLALNVALDGLK